METPGITFYFKLKCQCILLIHIWVAGSKVLLSAMQLEQKMVASEIFKDKKDNYPQSVSKLFVGTRLSEFPATFLAIMLIEFYCCYSDVFCVCADGEDLNPKVLQALGNEKMKVGFSSFGFEFFLFFLQFVP